jgi:hypothetical protein
MNNPNESVEDSIMSILNLVKVGATCFVVGAAIGTGIAAYKKHRNTMKVETQHDPIDETDPMVKAMREAAAKMGLTDVEITVTRTTHC